MRYAHQVCDTWLCGWWFTVRAREPEKGCSVVSMLITIEEESIKTGVIVIGKSVPKLVDIV